MGEERRAIRAIPPSMAPILEELEMEQPGLVTSEDLAELAQRHGVRSHPRAIAARLRDLGWLLPTPRQGVWEFAPAALAGPYSRNDPLTPLKAFLSKRANARCALTFQAAAWAHGVADRFPTRPEVAAADRQLAYQLPEELAPSVFSPNLAYQRLRDVPVLRPESVVTQMAARPAAVRSWSSAVEWLPELAELLEASRVSIELTGRPAAVRARTGYLLQRLRPDLATTIRDLGAPRSTTWFGPRASLRRHDSTWLIADTILPFDPRDLRQAV